MLYLLDPTQRGAGHENISSSLKEGSESRGNEEAQHCQETGKFSAGQGLRLFEKSFLYREKFAHREKIHRNVITERRSEAQRRPGERVRS